MPYSVIHCGKVLDFHYKKAKHLSKGTVNFYIGDIFIGIIFRMGKEEYSAVPKEPCAFAPVDGFKSRFHASKFMLEYQRYWRKN